MARLQLNIPFNAKGTNFPLIFIDRALISFLTRIAQQPILRK